MVSDEGLQVADALLIVREMAEEASRLHQPDGLGFCLLCDPMVAYPCGPKWYADRALDWFDRWSAKT